MILKPKMLLKYSLVFDLSRATSLVKTENRPKSIKTEKRAAKEMAKVYLPKLSAPK